MPPLKKDLADLLKPLRLEEKQDFTNRSVVGGLDRFLMKRLESIGQDLPPGGTGTKPLADYLRGLRGAFTQYMTLRNEERRLLVSRAIVDLRDWADKAEGLDQTAARPSSVLEDEILPLVPKDKVRAFQLTKLKRVEELLYFSPKWAVHQSLLSTIAQAEKKEETPFLKARINGVSQTRQGKREMLKVILEDGSGHLTWVWFNRPYLKKEMTAGRWVLLHDKPQVSPWGKQIIGRADAFEFLTEEEHQALNSGKVMVVYPSTPTLTQAFWKDLIGKVLEKTKRSLPETIDPGSKLPDLSEAFLRIHDPKSLEDFEAARQRLAYEELFLLQAFLILKRNEVESRRKGRTYQFEGPGVLKFRKTIPYQLTQAQRRVVKEIRTNLGQPYPMNRLLQGDVGSGKTLVASICFLYAADSGIQSALLAPTEILAQQHFRTIGQLLGPVGLRTALLTSDMKAKEKRETLEKLREGQVDLAVGTHALLEPDVRFKDLGFMVIDERHKFGVLQRAALEQKGRWPDVLMMTATPFPRALVLTEYGDTDLSVLDESPKGRKPIQTAWKTEAQKTEVYQFIRERVLKGEQAYLVYPVVDESKNFLRSAIQMYRFFKDQTFHGFKVGLLHGKMDKEEKELVMRDFVGKKIQILVSTTVVEVGLDVSNATIMVVEHAERFGLAQLHQLRGRVGRGSDQSYCFLITSQLISREAVERVKMMVSTNDGFKLSEFDLRTRGPGEIFGVAQSGRREGGLVDLKRDVEIVDKARAAAKGSWGRTPSWKGRTKGYCGRSWGTVIKVY